MNTVRLNSPKDLEHFLRILAEESVAAAKADIQMPKPDEKARQKSFQSRIPKDKRALSEEDPPADDAAAAADPAAGVTPDEPPASPEPPAADSAPSEPTKSAESASTPTFSEVNPTISAVVDAIKEIRGGRGAGDSAIEAELTAYFDRLQDAEKTSLVVMLRSLGGILRQQLKGADAPEPSSYKIFTSMQSDVKSKEEKTSPESGATPAVSPEDTSPPIKVGEPVSEVYRSRIRNLLSKNR